MLKPTVEAAETIAKNTAVLLASDVASKVLLFLYTMFIARYLGASGYGIVAFAMAFTSLFIIFSDMGLGILTTREVAKDKSLARKYLNNNLSIKLILVTVTYGAIAIAINVMDYPPETIRVVYVSGAAIVCLAFTELFQSLFRAFERMEYIAVGGIINAAIILGGAFLVIHFGLGVMSVVLVYLIAQVVTLGYSFFMFATRFIVPKFEVDFGFWKWLLREGWPFAMFMIAARIATRIDIVMLSAMKGDEVVGYYQAAVNVAVALQFIPLTVINSFFPKLSEYHQHKELLEDLARRMNRILFAIAILLTTGTFFFADRVIPVVYGGEFTQSIILLQILSIFLFVTYIPADGIILNAIGKQRLKFYAGLGMVATNVILNLIFIPQYGAVAAAVTTIVSYIVLRIAYVTLVRRQGLKTFTFDYSLVVITLAGIGLGFVFGRLLDELHLALSLSLNTASYFAITYFWFIKKDEREFINSFLKKSISYLTQISGRDKGGR